MKHLAITMMLLLGSIMMEIQVCTMMVIMEYGTLTITKVKNMSHVMIKTGKETETSKSSDGSNTRKVVISAPAATITSNDKTTSLSDDVQAGAAATIAAEKKEKEKMKEIRLASKSSILASKKKMSQNVIDFDQNFSIDLGAGDPSQNTA